MKNGLDFRVLRQKPWGKTEVISRHRSPNRAEEMLLKYSNDHEADYFELQVSVIHRQVKDGTTTFVERWEPVRSWIPGIGKRDFSKEME